MEYLIFVWFVICTTLGAVESRHSPVQLARHVSGNRTMLFEPVISMSILKRQACDSGFDICDSGLCCPNDTQCCGSGCTANENSCCGDGACPPGQGCCGADACKPDGWDCCGSNGDIYPLDGSACCSDGGHCGPGETCGDCGDGDGSICCFPADGAEDASTSGAALSSTSSSAYSETSAYESTSAPSSSATSTYGDSYAETSILSESQSTYLPSTSTPAYTATQSPTESPLPSDDPSTAAPSSTAAPEAGAHRVEAPAEEVPSSTPSSSPYSTFTEQDGDAEPPQSATPPSNTPKPASESPAEASTTVYENSPSNQPSQSTYDIPTVTESTSYIIPTSTDDAGYSSTPSTEQSYPAETNAGYGYSSSIQSYAAAQPTEYFTSSSPATVVVTPTATTYAENTHSPALATHLDYAQNAGLVPDADIATTVDHDTLSDNDASSSYYFSTLTYYNIQHYTDSNGVNMISTATDAPKTTTLSAFAKHTGDAEESFRSMIYDHDLAPVTGTIYTGASAATQKIDWAKVAMGGSSPRSRPFGSDWACVWISSLSVLTAALAVAL